MLEICCHEMRQNAFAAGALPRTPLEEHTELPQIDRAVARSSFSGSARKFGSLAGSSSKIRLTSPNVTSEELYSTFCGFPKVHRLPWRPYTPKKVFNAIYYKTKTCMYLA